MGWVLYRLNDYPQAIDFLNRAYELNDGAEIASHLGEVLWVSGDQQQATTVWQKAVNAESDNPVLIETLERFQVTLSPLVQH